MTIAITITTAGYDALINAGANGTNAIKITAFGLSEVAVNNDPSLTALPNELKRIGSVSGGVVAPDTIHVVLEDMGGDAYSLRAFGLYLSDGTLFGVYGQVDPILIKTASSDALLSADIKFADIDATSITFGATNFFNPPATETVQGVAEIATQDEANAGNDDQRIVTPYKAKRAVVSWLGYTPIQQGGGAGQLGNKLYIGWSGRRLKAQVDQVDQGFVTTDTELGFATIVLNGSAMRRNGLDLWGPDNDGAGSGLDADMLDGLDSSAYARLSTGAAFKGTVSAEGQLRVNSSGIGATAYWAMQPDGMYVLYAGYSNPIPVAAYNVNATGAFGFTVQLTVNGNKVWHAGNDGAGSGLDADTLDGQDSGYYADIPSRLGYTPVRQGTGYMQRQNLVAIGWDGSRLRAQVDASDQGPIWTSATDGAGSGLDADLLDGVDGSTYARRDQSVSFAGTVETQGDFRLGRTTDSTGYIIRPNIAGYKNMAFAVDGAGPLDNVNIVTFNLYRSGNRIWDAGNDGAGSGLDADMLDGLDSSAYAKLSGATFDGEVSASRFRARSNGDGQAISIGDDAWIGDANIPAGLVIRGQGTPSAGYVSFGTSGITLGCNAGDGTLRYGGSPIWHSGNDGAGSGLDADQLDGHDSGYFADIPSRLGFTPVRQGTGFNQFQNLVAIGWDGSRLRAQVDSSDQGPIWTAATDGSGSGLDADMLDGLDSGAFARALTDSNLGSEGHRVHADGYKECWGTVSVPARGSVYVPLPVGHGSWFKVALGAFIQSTANAQYNLGLVSKAGLDGFTLQNWEISPLDVDWSTRGV